MEVKVYDTEAHDHLEAVFAPEGKYLIAIANTVLSGAGIHQYPFMSEDDYRTLSQASIGRAMQVYWLEILYRAHYSALSALIRSSRWIDGIVDGYRAGNPYSFASCYRGLVESASDTLETFTKANPAVAGAFATIAKAIRGKLNAQVVVDGLEDALIHFMYARRLDAGEVAPETHRARPTTHYLEVLRRGASGAVASFYGELCNVTHPAGPSVLAYLRPLEDGSVFEYWPDGESELLRALLVHSEDHRVDILQLGINSSLIMLKILNRFGDPSVRTPALDRVDLSGLRGWHKIEAAIKESRHGTGAA